MPCLRNNLGFSILGHLIMLSIIVITLPFIGYMLQAVQPTSNQEELSVQQFFQFIRNDVIRSINASVTHNKLYLTIDGETNEGELDYKTALYEQHDNVIRRRVNGQGHEIYLRNISNIEFQSLEFGFTLIVTTISGDKYEKTISYYQ